MSIKISWLGHSCFRIEAAGYTVIIDPYTGVPGYRELGEHADMVLCSHSHGDHSSVQSVTLRQNGAACPFENTKIDSFHDDCGGQKRGANTIHVLEYERVRIAHFGDLGHELDAQTIARLGTCHAVMVPVGGYYTIDAQTAAGLKSSLDCRAFIPMHYRSGAAGFDVLAPIDDFLSLVDDVRHYPAGSIEIDCNTNRHTAVLKYI